MRKFEGEPDSQVGVDASGLDHEWRQELEDERRNSVLGRLGSTGYLQVIPEKINQRRQQTEQGDE